MELLKALMTLSFVVQNKKFFSMKIYLSIIFLLIINTSYSQVIDHFDDGEFSVLPKWSGDSSDFNVNLIGQLQLNALNAGNSFLSVPANLNSLDSSEWRFFIKLGFSPSSFNNSRIYLSSDQYDLQQPLNGYFLQFGESLSNDAIELFRQNGTTITSICRAQDGFIANSFSAGVKVERNSSGKWIVSVDYTGGENYNTEAIGVDSTFNTAAFIGVNCIYSSGNVSRFYFDDFYSGPSLKDTIKPNVVNINVESSTIISVTFSEKMEPLSMININNFRVDNGIGQPFNIFPDSSNHLKYYFEFSTTLHPNVNYVLTFSGLKDLNQNLLNDTSANFVYTPFAKAKLNDIVFSEIYFEPSSLSPLPKAEFVELYNRKDSSVLILGWKISDGGSGGSIPAFRLEPQSYLVLYSANDSLEFLSIPNALAVESFPTLNNDVGDRLVLTDESGQLINELKFNDEYYDDNKKNDGGWTIEKINQNFICKNKENWRASSSISHGTPGHSNSVNGDFEDVSSPFVSNIFLIDSNSLIAVFNEAISEGLDDVNNFKITNNNGLIPLPVSAVPLGEDSVELKFSNPFSKGIYILQISSLIKDCPGNSINTYHTIKFGFPEKVESKDIIINELLFNSNEGGTDFLELFNASSKIIDLKDWIISETDYNDSLDILENAKLFPSHKYIFPGDYLVLTENEKKVKNFYFCKDEHAFLNVLPMPDFNSDNGRVIISDEFGKEIDAFVYSDEMHFALLSDHQGVSLERLSVKEFYDNDSNWHSAAATVGFATPGYENSQRLDHFIRGGEVSVEIEIFSPDNDGYNDVLPIHYKFPQTGTVLSLNVYDSNGLPVKQLLAGQTIGHEGTLIWDGLNDDKFMSASGIYILLARSFDLEGNENVIKKTCFLTRRF